MSASALQWIGAGAAIWLAGLTLLWALCRAAGIADAQMELHGEARMPAQAPRAADAFVEYASTRLAVEQVTLLAGADTQRLAVIARAGLELPPGAATRQLQYRVAGLAMERGHTVEQPGAPDGAHPGAFVAAAPVITRGRRLGALAVSGSRSRPALTFGQRRALRQLAGLAALLPAMAPAPPRAAGPNLTQEHAR
ncbi:MAG TPA: hypothetical protein VGJ70_17125 [Solirubrobacteraceae bacterium]